ncbi:unnamed protein product, partial [Didymodactylos carnosus]
MSLSRCRQLSQEQRSHAATYTLAMSEDNEPLVAAPYSAK